MEGWKAKKRLKARKVKSKKEFLVVWWSYSLRSEHREILRTNN